MSITISKVKDLTEVKNTCDLAQQFGYDIISVMHNPDTKLYEIVCQRESSLDNDEQGGRTIQAAWVEGENKIYTREDILYGRDRKGIDRKGNSQPSFGCETTWVQCDSSDLSIDYVKIFWNSSPLKAGDCYIASAHDPDPKHRTGSSVRLFNTGDLIINADIWSEDPSHNGDIWTVQYVITYSNGISPIHSSQVVLPTMTEKDKIYKVEVFSTYQGVPGTFPYINGCLLSGCC